jgi:ATP-dependent helicase/nuclease subunit A
MKRLGHKMILASAGSGKTYALTNRFVQLLAYGAPPERIVALTFTRKAAGEFFDEILNKLARAARDAEVAARIGAEIGEPSLGPADFLRMLRVMVGSMHRLSLGTLDGFFARVVRAFPLELGLGGDFEI